MYHCLFTLSEYKKVVHQTFEHMREVEAHYSAAIKYLRAHFCYAGRNGNRGELGAIPECIVREFLKVLRQFDIRQIGTPEEHFLAHRTHISWKFNALQRGQRWKQPDSSSRRSPSKTTFLRFLQFAKTEPLMIFTEAGITISLMPDPMNARKGTGLQIYANSG